MKTVILTWNPATSEYPLYDFMWGIDILNARENIDGSKYVLYWNLSDINQIQECDLFYWIKVGKYGQTGVVARGKFMANPKEANKKSANGRKLYVIEIIADILINPDALPLLTVTEIYKRIPDIKITSQEDGFVLSEEQAIAMESLWEEYFRANLKIFKNARNFKEGKNDLIYSTEIPVDKTLRNGR